MEQYLQYDAAYLASHGAKITASEIQNQPMVWRKLADMLEQEEPRIAEFMQRILAIPNLRIVFTGAGSSAFIGESLSLLLLRESGIRSENIHTTDIVATPDSVLYEAPTLLISFSRSGSSPESVGAIECASKLVPELYNLVLVCNRNSQLALMDQTDGKTMIVNIPQEASDMGFAMTCSVSCMMMASWYLFGDRDRAERLSYLRRLADAVEQAIPAISAQTKSIVTFDYDRIVYLGFGGLRGLAHEGSIKSQELTSGRVVASYDTPTGFRHGPKTVIEPRTLTVHLISPIPLAQLYDVDLLNEIMREQEGNMAVAVVPNGMLEGVVADWRLAYNIPAGYETSELSSYLYGLLFLQMLSFEKSLKLGLTPDTPCPDGGVNRVVQGVTLHKLA